MALILGKQEKRFNVRYFGEKTYKRSEVIVGQLLMVDFGHQMGINYFNNGLEFMERYKLDKNLGLDIKFQINGARTKT